MSIVKINAVQVPRERFEEFARRFAARAGRVDAARGFEGFAQPGGGKAAAGRGQRQHLRGPNSTKPR